MSFIDRLKVFAKKKTLGEQGELWALIEYRRAGYRLVERNYFNRKGLRLGEIDLIISDRKHLVFVEVKTRVGEDGRFGRGIDSVDGFKQAKILRAVKQFLTTNPKLQELEPRIDVCEVIVQDFDKGKYYVKIYSNVVEDWN